MDLDPAFLSSGLGKISRRLNPTEKSQTNAAFNRDPAGIPGGRTMQVIVFASCRVRRRLHGQIDGATYFSGAYCLLFLASGPPSSSVRYTASRPFHSWPVPPRRETSERIPNRAALHS